VARQPTIQDVLQKAVIGSEPHREDLQLKGPNARTRPLPARDRPSAGRYLWCTIQLSYGDWSAYGRNSSPMCPMS
jgi:hypothetical protein